MSRKRGLKSRKKAVWGRKKRIVRFNSAVIALMFFLSSIFTALTFRKQVSGTGLLEADTQELSVSATDVSGGDAVSPQIDKTEKTDKADKTDSTVSSEQPRPKDTSAQPEVVEDEAVIEDIGQEVLDSSASEKVMDSTVGSKDAAADSTNASAPQDVSGFGNSSDAATPGSYSDVAAAGHLDAAPAGQVRTVDASEITFPKTISADHPLTLSEIGITGCSGDGVFAWEDAALKVGKGDTSCKVMFLPNDTLSKDYSAVEGWDASKQAVIRDVIVTVKDTAPDTDSDTKIEFDVIKAAEELVKNADSKGTTAKNSDILSKEISEDTLTIPKGDEAKEEVADDPFVRASQEGYEFKYNDIPEKDKTVAESPDSSGDTSAGAEIEKPADAAKYPAAEVEKAIDALPSGIKDSSDVTAVIDAMNLYLELGDELKGSISDEALSKLLAAQDAVAAYNFTSEGITISGDCLKWYVQLRVSKSNDTSAYTAPNIDTLIAPYELTLWDTLNNCEFTIPEGQRVTVAIPLENMGDYEHLVVIHYKNDGSIEYITPQTDGDYLYFDTDSFSPFDIAGSKILIGGGVVSQLYGIDNPSDTSGTDTSGTNTGTNTENNSGGTASTNNYDNYNYNYDSGLGSSNSNSSGNTGSSSGQGNSLYSGYSGTSGKNSAGTTGSGSSYTYGTTPYQSTIRAASAVLTGDDTDTKIYFIAACTCFVIAFAMVCYNIKQSLEAKRRANSRRRII